MSACAIQLTFCKFTLCSCSPFLEPGLFFSVMRLMIFGPPEIIKICFSLLQVVSRTEMSSERCLRLL